MRVASHAVVQDQIRALLGGVPSQRLILLDLFAETQPQWSRTGAPTRVALSPAAVALFPGCMAFHSGSTAYDPPGLIGLLGWLHSKAKARP
jgi:hypothetical protein